MELQALQQECLACRRCGLCEQRHSVVFGQGAAHAEVMTFDFPLVEGKDAVLRFHWGTTSVPMTVTVP